MKSNEKHKASGQYPHVTPRAKQILNLLAEGYEGPEIAAQLKLSLSTVNQHRYLLYSSLNTSNVIGTVARAVELGWVRPDFWKKAAKLVAREPRGVRPRGRRYKSRAAA